MPLPSRVSPGYVRDRLRARGDLLLVCAYEDESKCEPIQVDGAISLKEFERRLPSLPWSQEIVFY